MGGFFVDHSVFIVLIPYTIELDISWIPYTIELYRSTFEEF